MLRCLVVDDDRVVRKIVSKYLEDYGIVSFAENGKQALRLFEDALDAEMPFQLITLDIVMPVMDGHETLRAIRKLEQERDITDTDRVCVLMLSSMDDEQNIDSAFDEKCEGFMSKPFDKEDLRTHLELFGLLD